MLTDKITKDGLTLAKSWSVAMAHYILDIDDYVGFEGGHEGDPNDDAENAWNELVKIAEETTGRQTPWRQLQAEMIKALVVVDRPGQLQDRQGG